MLTTNKCRELLGPKCKLDDAKIVDLRDALYGYVDVVFSVKEDAVREKILNDMLILSDIGKGDNTAIWYFINLYFERRISEIQGEITNLYHENTTDNLPPNMSALELRGKVKAIANNTFEKYPHQQTFIVCLPSKWGVYYSRLWRAIEIRIIDAITDYRPRSIADLNPILMQTFFDDLWLSVRAEYPQMNGEIG